MCAFAHLAVRALTALAVTSLTAASGQLLLGPPAELPTGDAEQVLLGDVNEDGHLDLVVLPDFMVFSDNTTYSVALGNGDGTFAPAVQNASLSSFWGRGQLADVDDDGHLDLVVPAQTSGGSPHVRVLHGVGDGTFGAVQQVGNHSFSGSVCIVRDVDADGDLDLIEAVSGFSGADLYVHLGNGVGGFSSLPAIPVGLENPLEYAWDVDVADLDADGLLDIVAVSNSTIVVSSTLSVLLGTGPASWAPQVTSPLAGTPHDLELIDYDGNGTLDLAVRIAEGNVLLLPGGGDGTFGAWTLLPVGPSAPANAGVRMASGDLDGDGVVDLVVPRPTELLALRGLGDGTFEPLVVSQFFALDGLALGDLDEDGDLDIAVGGSVDCGGGDCAGRVSVVLNETYLPGSPFLDLGHPLQGANGWPIHIASGTLAVHTPFEFFATNGPPSAPAYLLAGLSELSAPFKGGVMVPDPTVTGVFVTDAGGDATVAGLWPNGLTSGTSLWMQWWFADAGGPAGYSATSGLRATTP